jgi:prepilin-type N-terminal cleavage/methylation domain-containing protein
MLIQPGVNPRASSPVFLKRGPAGFTLLEIMVGVGVLGMLLISMYQLVGTQLLALQTTRETQVESVAMQGLVRYVQGVLAGLPLRQNDVLRGVHHVYGMVPADELQWISRPGMGLLTSAAADDDYALTLTIQPRTSTSRRQDLGIRRRLVTEPDSSYEWITLLPDTVALEFAYFHPSLGLWQEKWEDTNTRPTLVRMKVWRREGEEPFEVVLPVPSARIQ